MYRTNSGKSMRHTHAKSTNSCPLAVNILIMAASHTLHVLLVLFGPWVLSYMCQQQERRH